MTMPAPLVQDFRDIQRNFEYLDQRIRWGKGVPEALEPGRMGKVYVDELTGKLYVKTTNTGLTGWVEK
jgi:hypothetical protein